MIISKKKFIEKVREEVERAERERWLNDKIDRVERECHEMIEGAHRHICEVEKKFAELKKKYTEKDDGT